MLVRPDVKRTVFQTCWAALGPLSYLAAAWLVQTPFFIASHPARLIDFLFIMVVSGPGVLVLHGERILASPALRRLNGAALAATMVSASMMAIAFVDGVLAGHAGEASGAAAAQLTVPSRAGASLFFSPRVLAWAVFTLGVWRVLLRLYDHRAEVVRQAGMLREAQDAALRARMAPHFIFNALNTLKAQIELAPSEAAATADRLASLFRQVLDLADRPRIPLREELGFVETYLGIERARLGSRLRVKVEVSEDVEAVEIPPLSLQVLVENAVKHGVAPREEGGEIRIWARWNDAGPFRKLEAGVESPAGPAATATPAAGTGTGLAALRGRLERPTDLETRVRGNRFLAQFVWRGTEG